MYLLKRIFSGIGVLSILLAHASDTTRAYVYKPILPESQHGTVFQTAVQFISAYHYSKPKIDDNMSSKAFDNYLKHLDPAKQYFLESDLKQFEYFRYQIDDAVMSGIIQPAFEMYNLYQKRFQERMEYVNKLLKRDFEYTSNETYDYDRENAPWCKSMSEMDDLWRKKVKYECLAIRVTGKDSSYYLETIRKRYDNLAKLTSKTKSEEVFAFFLNSITELADPHTNYFSPYIADAFNQSMSLSLEGIGAQLQTENEYTKIREIIKGGPADRSKLLFANDRIIGVSQGKDSEMVNVIDWRIDDVVSRIRGKKGTVVRLEIIPASDPNSTKVVELIRDKIVLEDQSAKCTIKNIDANGRKIKMGVIHIPTFYIDFAAYGRGEKDYKSTTRDVKKLIDSLKKENVQGIIIDLRNNGGGSLQEAIELSGLFIKTGAVVQVKDANGSIDEQLDNNPEVYYNGPLAIMVNRFSASASEIFSAAMQDYQRAIIVGERTYGKGTVQNLVDLNQFLNINNKKLGQIKLTIAKFYRINGSSTQHQGVTPDIVFPGMYDEAKYGEGASPYALKWDQVKPTSFAPVGNLAKSIETIKAKHQQRMSHSVEYNYLKQDIQELKISEKKQSVSLQEQAFKAENYKAEKQKKERDEVRKKEKETNADASDLILNDTEQILVDLLQMGK
jgi:carboxyl-terminal processing protease